MATTSVLIGSRPSIPTTTLVVTANAVAENLVFTGGDFYLYHPTGALSLLTEVAALLNTHSELVGCSAVITRSGRVRLACATAFALTWGSDLTLRNLLGYAAGLASSTAHVAPATSPLYWSPGRTESSRAPLGSDGLIKRDTQAGRSGPGIVVATTNNSWRVNDFHWRYVGISRLWQNPAANGTWETWWGEVGAHYRRFWLARNVTEDLADTTTAMTLSTKLPSSGAYIWRHGEEVEQQHQREVEYLDAYGRVDLPVETALEYGA